GAPVTFTLGSLSANATTDATGTATTIITLSIAPGTYSLQAAYAGGANLLPANTSQAFTVTAPTALALTAPSSAGSGATFSVSATLTDAQSSSPISGAALSFTLGTVNANATTNASGVAATTMTASVPPGPYTLSAAYAGDSTHA